MLGIRLRGSCLKHDISSIYSITLQVENWQIHVSGVCPKMFCTGWVSRAADDCLANQGEKYLSKKKQGAVQSTNHASYRQTLHKRTTCPKPCLSASFCGSSSSCAHRRRQFLVCLISSLFPFVNIFGNIYIYLYTCIHVYMDRCRHACIHRFV